MATFIGDVDFVFVLGVGDEVRLWLDDDVRPRSSFIPEADHRSMFAVKA